MGFALQQHPPRWEKVRLYHQMASWTLGLMAAGIALRFVAEPMASASNGIWIPLGVFSCLLQLAAVALFMANTAVTRHPTGEGLTWQTKFVFASLGWLMLIAAVDPLLFPAAHGKAALGFIAEWFPPLREAQFLGFVSNMIFGVALVKMHTCFGARPAIRSLGNAAFFIWNVGLFMRIAGWVAYFRSGMSPASMWMYSLSGVVLAGGAVAFVAASRMFERLEFSIPSHKFNRGAFTWLLISGLLLILEPLNLRFTDQPFSHAYIGGVRHALTVGFISQMIIGVGTHVIGRMNDVPDRLKKALWPTFVLLNLGNAGRVALEIASDYTPKAFPPMGVTGFIELVGLAIWGISMASLMLRRRPRADASSPHPERMGIHSPAN